MPKTFQKCKEEFLCEICCANVQGDGYTNHCPYCLWSKHVDINPGDRQNSCGGLMEPIDVEQSHGEYILIHRCKNCGSKKRQRTSKKDDFSQLIQIVSRGNG